MRMWRGWCARGARTRKAMTAAVAVVLMASISAGAVARTSAPQASKQLKASPAPAADLQGTARIARDAVRSESTPPTPSELRVAGRSRQRFADLGPEAARTLAEDSFEEQLTASTWEPLTLGSGDRVVEYRGATAAIIRDANGDKTLAQSTLPLRSTVGTGELAPVDMALQADGDSVAPANPLVATEIAVADPGAVSFAGEHTTVTLAGADDGAATEYDPNHVFIASALTDTDVVLRPTPNGASYSFVVRSDAAPQAAALDFDLPSGAVLRTAPDVPGAVEIVADGKAVGIVHPPVAWDADHRDVAVSYAVDGERITVNYPFDDPELRFPLYVDPVIDWYRVYDGTRYDFSDASFNGWTQRTNRPGSFGLSKNGSSYGPGLYAYTLEGATYNNGDYAQWTWQVPQPEAYIESVDFGYLDHDWGLGFKGSTFSGFTCVIEGIWGDTDWNYGAWTQKPGYPQPTIAISSPWVAANTTLDEPTRNACHAQTANFKNHRPTSPTRRNTATVGIQVVSNQPGLSFPAASRGLTHLYGATLYLNDTQVPTTTQIADVPTGWVNTGVSAVKVTAIDNGGLGVRSLHFAPPGAGYIDRPMGTNGQATSQAGACVGGGYNSPCANSATDWFSVNHGTLPEGQSSRSWAMAFDAVGKPSPAISADFKVDHTKPDAVTMGGTILGTGIQPGQSYNITATATDALSGVNRIKLTLDDAPLPGLPNGTYDRGCATVGCSPKQASLPATAISTAGMAYGSTHKITAQAFDAVGIPGEVTTKWFTITDTTKPDLTLSGGVTRVPAADRELIMTAQDHGQGLRRVQAWVVAPGTVPGAGVAPAYDAGDLCPSGSSCPTTPVVKSWTLGPEVTPGRYDLYVVATDVAGNASLPKRVRVLVVDLRRGAPTKLGLEQWLDYDETATGGGSNLYVNADTGNAVWNQLPIVDRGRGLSTVVNLTYNSQDRGGLLGLDFGSIPVLDSGVGTGLPLADDLLDASYGEIGPGFSLGISGPTRVNEPLRGVLLAQILEEGPIAGVTLPGGWQPKITMTDPDGTRHTFTRDASSGEWKSPAGVDLHLRRFAPGGDLINVVTRKWAMTRPDGVTYFFDSLGYLSSIEDRNANTITYTYERYNALLPTSTGNALCTVNDLLGSLLSTTKICARRLTKVTDPAGRTLTIGYRSGAIVDPVNLELNQSLGIIQNLPASLPALLGGTPGRIASIADSMSGRTLTFGYDGDGFLTRLIEAANESDPAARRVTDFKYEPWSGPLHLGQDRLLTAVVEMHRRPTDSDYTERSRTTIAYESAGGLPAVLGVGPPRKVTSVTERDETPQVYAYPRTANETFTVTERASAGGTSPGGRALAPATLKSVHKLDAAGKVTDLTDPNGTTTHLEWNDAINAVTAMTRAFGSSPDQASRTEYEYDTSKQTPVLVHKREYPNYPDTSGKREATIEHAFSAGVERLQSAGGSDDGGTFVADVSAISQPKAGTGWTFGLQDGDTGNVVSRTDARGYQSTTTYTTVVDAPLPLGLITSETDENGDTTTYSDWHASGQPQTVTKPTEPGKPLDFRRWTYRYNGVGDVTAVVDPRATDRSGTEGSPFTTTLRYDAFDRVTRVNEPKKSTADSDAPREYLTRSFAYDRNDNLTRSVDAAGHATTVDYTKVDTPLRVVEPSASHGGTRTTAYAYDDAARLVARVDALGDTSDVALGALPLSQRAACEQDERPALTHVTGYCIDQAGRLVAELGYDASQTAASKQRVLIRSHAYDARDNLVGSIDARRNSARTIPEAIAAAADPAKQREHRAYNRVDERTATTRDPGAVTPSGGGTDGPYTETYEYDANGNVRFVHDARNAGYVTERVYDQRDQLIAEIDPLGHETCTARRKDGSVLAVTTPRGTAGDKDRCVEDIDPDNPAGLYDEYTTVYGYDHVGDLASRTLPFRSGQYGRSDAELRRWRVTYDRDAVGNPTTIYDARTNASDASPSPTAPSAIRNTFYDTGELLSTTRPSWWQPAVAGASPIPSAGRRYGASVDVDVDVDAPVLTERDGAVAADDDGAGELPADAGSGDLGDVARSPLPSLLPRAGRTTFAYDAEMRLTRVADAAGDVRAIDYYDDGSVEEKRWPFKSGDPITHRFGYDAKGNLTSSAITDPLSDGGPAATSTLTYDGHDRLMRLTQPGARKSPDAPTAIPDEVTVFGYDHNANVTSRETPRGAATATDGDHTFGYAYDGLDRLHYETNPAGEHVLYGYDAADNVLAARSPLGWNAPAGDIELYREDLTYDAAGQLHTSTRTVDDHPFVGDPQRTTLTTTLSHDDDGNRTKVVAPGARNDASSDVFDRITQTEYDGRGLPWVSTIGNGAGERSSLTEYDPNGNLRRSVSPRGVDQTADRQEVVDAGTDTVANLDAASQDATVYTYDEHDLPISTRLPWNASDTRRFRKDVQRDGDPLRRALSVLSPYEADAAKTPRTSYTYYASGWVHTVSNEKTTKTTSTAPISDRSVTYDYDHRGDQTLWLTTGYPDSTQSRRISRSYYPNGLLRSRVARKPESGETDPSIRSYSYYYDENGSLSTFRDQQLARDTVITRDPAGRQLGVDEDWSGGRDTRYTYDGAGNLATRRTDGTIATDGSYGGADAKTTTIEDDSLGREYRLTVDPAHGSQRVTRTRWWGSGELRARRKPNGTTDSWYWTSRGTAARHERERSDGTDADPVAYAYDDNDNRTADERGTYAFNARDQLVRWERPASHPAKPGYVTTYTLRGDGSMRFVAEGDAQSNRRRTVKYEYDADGEGEGERLRRTTTKVYAPGQSTPQDTHRTAFEYDNFGSVVTATSTQQGGVVPDDIDESDVAPPDDCDQGTARLRAGVTIYCYDEFERQTFSKGYGIEDPAKIAYDGLDRRDSKTTYPASGDPVKRDFSYVGATELLSHDAPTGSGTGEVRTYDYDSAGARQGAAGGSAGSPRYHAYDLDANGSVLGLENDDGSVPDNQRYLYDPYGELESGGDADAEDELAADAKANPFRFQGFFYDSGVKTYDMRARAYRPDIGRFLSQDQLESAIGDQGLQADALTQNRYAFAGANPVSNVEFDGHATKAERRRAKRAAAELYAPGTAAYGHMLGYYLRDADEAAKSLRVGRRADRGQARLEATARRTRAAISADRAEAAQRDRSQSGLTSFVVDLVKPDVASAGGILLTVCKWCKAAAVAGRGLAAVARNNRYLRPLEKLLRGRATAPKAGDDVLRLGTSQSWGRLDTLADHFARHGADFGARSADDYARMASEFFQRAQRSGLPTKVDGRGTIRVYDPKTNTFGSYNATGTSKTFYKPNPAQHGYPSNQAYWDAQPGSAPWTP